MKLEREANTGATAANPMIDGRALANGSVFTVILDNTTSEEWPWALVSGNVRLVEGCAVQYKNHRMNITGADPNFYNLDTPIDSILYGTSNNASGGVIDTFGYVTPANGGWSLATSASGTTLTQSTVAGPPGFVNSQLHLHATGLATATLNANILVRPGELYWMSCWANITSGASAQIGANFANSSGLVSFVPIADAVGIGANNWTFVEGPIVVPAQATFMTIGARITVSGDLLFTDIRIRRAN
jgi:hypothetical protein